MLYSVESAVLVLPIVFWQTAPTAVRSLSRVNLPIHSYICNLTDSPSTINTVGRIFRIDCDCIWLGTGAVLLRNFCPAPSRKVNWKISFCWDGSCWWKKFWPISGGISRNSICVWAAWPLNQCGQFSKAVLSLNIKFRDLKKKNSQSNTWFQAFTECLSIT